MRSWLPMELTRLQPYSLCPLFGPLGLHEVAPMLPPQTVARIDDVASTGGIGGGAEREILTCLVAPRPVQMAARKQGINAVIMIRPKGIELVNPRLEATADRIARHQSEADRINQAVGEVVQALGVEV